jgi:hypothetical protein
MEQVHLRKMNIIICGLLCLENCISILWRLNLSSITVGVIPSDGDGAPRETHFKKVIMNYNCTGRKESMSDPVRWIRLFRVENGSE